MQEGRQNIRNCKYRGQGAVLEIFLLHERMGSLLPSIGDPVREVRLSAL